MPYSDHRTREIGDGGLSSSVPGQNPGRSGRRPAFCRPARDASSSEGYWIEFHAVVVAGIFTSSRPFSVLVAKSGMRAHDTDHLARPAIIAAWKRQVGEQWDSAMLLSGSLPMSSAEMILTMLSAFFLTENGVFNALGGIPVTTTVSTRVASPWLAPAPVPAFAGPARLRGNITASSALCKRRWRFSWCVKWRRTPPFGLVSEGSFLTVIQIVTVGL